MIILVFHGWMARLVFRVLEVYDKPVDNLQSIWVLPALGVKPAASSLLTVSQESCHGIVKLGSEDSVYKPTS